MSFTREQVLHVLQNSPPQEGTPLAEKLLLEPDATLVDPLIGGVLTSKRTIKVADIVGTWRSRLRHTRTSGKRLYGLESFVSRMTLASDATELRHVAFKSRELTGLFWFEAISGDLFGFVLTKNEMIPRSGQQA